MPVTNVGQLERFTTLCGASIPAALMERLEGVRDNDQAVILEGINWATEQCRALLEGGAPGVHFYTLNRSHSTRHVYQNLMA
jgi:methylenetetrahydrofolate reductase (NADPH)